MGAAIIRTTSYLVRTNDFSSKSIIVRLRNPLSTNYFVIFEPMWEVETIGATSPNVVGFRVTADPYGTGDLTTAAGNWLEIERDSATGSVNPGFVLKVVESLGDHDGAGFRLLDVKSTAIAAAGVLGAQAVTSTANTPWDDASRVVLFGGFYGGGATTSGNSASDQASLGGRIYPSGSATINIVRYDPSGAGCEAATFVTYVVQWGVEWQVQRVTVTGSNGGSGLNLAGEYNTAAISSVARATSWVWATGWSAGTGMGFRGIVVTLGDGVTQNAAETTVAAGTFTTTSISVEVYVMTNRRLAAAWTFHANADITQTYTFSGQALPVQNELEFSDPYGIDSIVGARLPFVWTSIETDSTTYSTDLGFGSYVLQANGDAVRVRRGSVTPTWAFTAWLQVVDFGGIVATQNRGRAIRVTSYEVGAADFASLTLDLELLFDLQANYFVMVKGARGDIAQPPPDTSFVRVTKDPFGTGGLAVSTGANIIRLVRETNTGSWRGVVTVVESMSDHDGEGFRLRDVVEVSATAPAAVSQDGTATATSPWVDVDRVVLFGGPGGGGVQTATTSLSRVATAYAAFWPSGTATVNYHRHGNVTSSLEAATFTVYCVEWGYSWRIARLDLLGLRGGGADLDAVGDYSEVALGAQVDPDRAWLYTTGTAGDDNTDAGPMSVVAVLGDGVTVDDPASSAAVGLWAIGNAYVVLYVISHPGLAVDQRFIATTSTTSATTTIDTITTDEAYGTTNQGIDYTAGYRAVVIDTACSLNTVGDVNSATVFARGANQSSARYKRTDGTGTFAGWLQAIDFTGVTYSTDDEADSATPGPEAWLIVRDPRYVGPTNILSATSQAGGYVGQLIPDTDNLGSVVGFQEGDPQGTTELEYQITTGGSTRRPVGQVAFGLGGYAWRRSGETAWKAMNALTLFEFTNSVFTSAAAYGHCLAYSSVYRRVLVVTVTSATNIRIQYRSVESGNNGTYTTVNKTVTNALFAGTPNAAAVAVVEVPDGALLLLYATLPAYGAGSDMSVLRSTDGGVTWTAVLSALYARTVSGLGIATQTDLRAATSGDWVRFCVSPILGSAVSSKKLNSFVSADRGASWAATAETVAQTFSIYAWAAAASAYEGSFPWDIVGLDGDVGMFLLAKLNSEADTSVRIFYATRDGNWTAASSLDLSYTLIRDGSSALTAPKIKGICWVKTPDLLWLYIWVGGSDGDEVYAYNVDPSAPLDATSWTASGLITRNRGVMKYGPYRWRGIWAGNQILLGGGIQDPDTLSLADCLKTGSMLWQSGDWDVRPVNYVRKYDLLQSFIGEAICFPIIYWNSSMGALHGGTNADANTPWVRTQSGGATTQAWSSEWLTASTTNNTGENYWTYTSSDSWDDTAIHLICRVTANRRTPAVGIDVAMRVRYKATADVTVRIGVATLVLYDNIGAAALASLSGTALATALATNGIVIRLTEHAGKMLLAWRDLTAAGPDAWTESAEVTYTATAPGSSTVDLGIFSAATAGTSTAVFKEFWISSPAFTTGCLGQHTPEITIPDDWVGTLTTSGAVYIVDGILARWGGSGSFDGDTFTGELDYTRGSANIPIDSPQLFWESTSGVAQSLVLVADEDNTSLRFELDSLSLIGTVDRTCTVELNDADSWTSPWVSVELTADLFVGLEVVDVRGNMVRLAARDTSTGLPLAGEVGRMFLRFVLAGSATGSTYEIVSDQDPDGGWFTLDTSTDLALTVTPGSVAVIFGDRMTYRWEDIQRYRFMRVTFPAETTTTSTHRLGAMVPGVAYDFEVPLAWTWLDDQEPNVSEYRTRGAVSWQVEEGPAQRILQGRFVGDATQRQREELRGLLRKYQGYSVYPLVLVVDNMRKTGTTVYGRWTSGGKLDNTGWVLDSMGTWRPAGDLEMLFTEEP